MGGDEFDDECAAPSSMAKERCFVAGRGVLGAVMRRMNE
jgi:hypothetical protein